MNNNVSLTELSSGRVMEENQVFLLGQQFGPQNNYSGANDVISIFVRVLSSVVQYCGLSSVETASVDCSGYVWSQC